LLHLFGVHGFVNHPSYLYITAKGEPTKVIIRAPVRKEFEREPGVEEETEFLHTNLEKACEEEVSALVKCNEQGEAEDELEYL
jgi:hypothetical protein